MGIVWRSQWPPPSDRWAYPLVQLVVASIIIISATDCPSGVSTSLGDWELRYDLWNTFPIELTMSWVGDLYYNIIPKSPNLTLVSRYTVWSRHMYSKSLSFPPLSSYTEACSCQWDCWSHSSREYWQLPRCGWIFSNSTDTWTWATRNS